MLTSSQVKFLLPALPTQIKNSPPLVPGAGSSRCRRNFALLARVVRAAGMKRRRRISSFSFCICLSKESTTNKCRLDSRRPCVVLTVVICWLIIIIDHWLLAAGGGWCRFSLGECYMGRSLLGHMDVAYSKNKEKGPADR